MVFNYSRVYEESVFRFYVLKCKVKPQIYWCLWILTFFLEPRTFTYNTPSYSDNLIWETMGSNIPSVPKIFKLYIWTRKLGKWHLCSVILLHPLNHPKWRWVKREQLIFLYLFVRKYINNNPCIPSTWWIVLTTFCRHFTSCLSHVKHVFNVWY